MRHLFEISVQFGKHSDVSGNVIHFTDEFDLFLFQFFVVEFDDQVDQVVEPLLYLLAPVQNGLLDVDARHLDKSQTDFIRQGLVQLVDFAGHVVDVLQNLVQILVQFVQFGVSAVFVLRHLALQLRLQLALVRVHPVVGLDRQFRRLFLHQLQECEGGFDCLLRHLFQFILGVPQPDVFVWECAFLDVFIVWLRGRSVGRVEDRCFEFGLVSSFVQVFHEDHFDLVNFGQHFDALFLRIQNQFDDFERIGFILEVLLELRFLQVSLVDFFEPRHNFENNQ